MGHSSKRAFVSLLLHSKRKCTTLKAKLYLGNFFITGHPDISKYGVTCVTIVVDFFYSSAMLTSNVYIVERLLSLIGLFQI